MKMHHLKTWPEPFQAILDGFKRFEFRRNDRGFQVGDIVILREWVPNNSPRPVITHCCYTGREYTLVIEHLVLGGQFGIPAESCIFSWGKAERDQALAEFTDVEQERDQAQVTLTAQRDELLAACEAMIKNCDRYLETGIPADAKESKRLYDQMIQAIAKAKEKSNE